MTEPSAQRAVTTTASFSRAVGWAHEINQPQSPRESSTASVGSPSVGLIRRARLATANQHWAEVGVSAELRSGHWIMAGMGSQEPRTGIRRRLVTARRLRRESRARVKLNLNSRRLICAVTVVSFGASVLPSLAQRASLPHWALGMARSGRITAENQSFEQSFVGLAFRAGLDRCPSHLAVRDDVPCRPVYQTRPVASALTDDSFRSHGDPSSKKATQRALSGWARAGQVAREQACLSRC